MSRSCYVYLASATGGQVLIWSPVFFVYCQLYLYLTLLGSLRGKQAPKAIVMTLSEEIGTLALSLDI